MFFSEYPTGWSVATSHEDAFTHEELRINTKSKPCGPRCFLDMYSDEFQNAIEWDREPDVEALDSIITLAPNTLPCSLFRLLPQTDCYKVRTKPLTDVLVAHLNKPIRFLLGDAS
jgi:hypothetical protein